MRQVHALAAALCELTDQPWPETRAEASELIERLRLELGHPQPSLADVTLRTTRFHRRRDW